VLGLWGKPARSHAANASGSQSGTAGASALLSEAVSSQVGGRLEKLFGIQTFESILADRSGRDGGFAKRCRAGNSAAAGPREPDRDVWSNVGSTQQQVIQVEYNVNRNVSIVALRDYNGTFGIDKKSRSAFRRRPGASVRLCVAGRALVFFLGL